MFESCLRNFQKPDQKNGRASFVCSGSLFTCSRSQFFLRFALKASLWAERESCLRNFQKPDRFWSGFFRVTIIFFLIIRRNSLRRQKIIVNLQAENKINLRA